MFLPKDTHKLLQRIFSCARSSFTIETLVSIVFPSRAFLKVTLGRFYGSAKASALLVAKGWISLGYAI